MKKIVLIVSILFSSFFAQAQQAFEVTLTGTGQPIILIPGYSCSGQVWEETVKHLSKKYECHVITIAGFAGVKPIATPVLETVKNELITYIRNKHLQKPTLIGHSLGAFMSLWVASEMKNEVGKIICVDGLPALAAMGNEQLNYDSLRSNPMYNADMVAANFEALPTEGYEKNMTTAMLSQVSDTAHAAKIAHWSFLSDRKTLGYSIVEISLTDLRPVLKNISSPVLVIASLYGDAKNSEKVMNAQYANLANKQIQVANSKHFIMYDVPEWFYAQIDSFL